MTIYIVRYKDYEGDVDTVEAEAETPNELLERYTKSHCTVLKIYEIWNVWEPETTLKLRSA